MKTYKYLIFFLIAYSLQLTAFSHADTIETKDGKELKGIVVEDYKDRVILSTADGETTVMKSDIGELYYDSEEDNLIKLAQQAKDKKEYMKSFVYYDKVLKMDQNSKAAQDGVVFLQAYLFRKEEAQKEDDVKKREAIENYGAAIPTELTDEEKDKKAAESLKKLIGVSLRTEDGFPVVDSVALRSPADEAGIKKGDRIMAVWARLTGYLSPREVSAMLLDKPSPELKITIERVSDLEFKYGNATGASLSMEFDGLTVSGVKDPSPAVRAGIKKGDLITAIDGQSTRYMPLKKAMDIIKQTKERHVVFNIKKEAVIWRRD